MKGFKCELEARDEGNNYMWSYNFSGNTSYVDLFCKFKLNNINIDSIKIEPFWGLSVGLPVRQAYKVDGNWGKEKGSNWLWDGHRWEFTLAVAIPIGVDFNINQRFIVGYEFNIDFINIFTDSWEVDFFMGYTSHIVSIGYLF